MKRLALRVMLSSLLLTLPLMSGGDISVVKASPEIFQGDLTLAGNNVTTIEGRFDINGSIVVEENATLILRNTIVNFTQSEDYQFNMRFENPLNGFPRLLVENATIVANGYMAIPFFGNSSALMNNLMASEIMVYLAESSVASISDSTFYTVDTYGYSDFTISNSSVDYISNYDRSDVSISNCAIGTIWAEGQSADVSDSIIDWQLFAAVYSANCSINRLQPGLVNQWNFELNCSAEVAPGQAAPNITITNTQVDGWSFSFRESSNATIYNSELRMMYVYESANVSVYNSLLSFELTSLDASNTRFHNSAIHDLRTQDDSRVWLINSTSNTHDVRHQSEVYVCWYLNVHVIDSIGQDVPSANVTAKYPNATAAESELTDAEGWAGLTLMEKMMNATGEHPFGNYTIEATYEAHSNSTTVNITDNQSTTLVFSELIIPELPLFLIAPLFMAIALLTTIICKRKGPSNTRKEDQEKT